MVPIILSSNVHDLRIYISAKFDLYIHHAEKLHKVHKDHPEKKLRILRIYGRAVERKVYPGPYGNQEAFPKQESGYEYEQFIEEYALHYKIRRSGSEASAIVIELEKQFRELPRECIATSSTCTMYKTALSEAEAEILSQMFDIVLCTCNEASSQRVKKHIFPRQCIIDECGMAYEPEAIAPICLCDHVVLIGDHKQLQPVIKYPPAKDHGLSTSLFQRYAQHFPSFCKTLTIQYRMVSITQNVLIPFLYTVILKSFPHSMKKFVPFLPKTSTMGS